MSSITARTPPSCRRILYKAPSLRSPPSQLSFSTSTFACFTAAPLSRAPICSSYQSTMHFNTLSVLTLLAVFAGVHAQSDTDTAPYGISDCLFTCVKQASDSTGCSLYVVTISLSAYSVEALT